MVKLSVCCGNGELLTLQPTFGFLFCLCCRQNITVLLTGTVWWGPLKDLLSKKLRICRKLLKILFKEVCLARVVDVDVKEVFDSSTIQ